MNKKELDRGSKSIVTHDQKTQNITVTHPNESDNQKSFTFDCVFDWDSQQKVVYEQCAFNMVESVIEGKFFIIFQNLNKQRL